MAVIQKLHMATMDIKSAYLNAPLPQDSDWVVTTLEHHIAIACGLDPAKEYRALYGLPDSGRIVYLQLFSQKGPVHHVRLRFYRITPTETTYIIVYVDDTFIFSNSRANIDTVINSIGKHYEVTLDKFSRTTQHRRNCYNYPAK